MGVQSHSETHRVSAKAPAVSAPSQIQTVAAFFDFAPQTLPPVPLAWSTITLAPAGFSDLITSGYVLGAVASDGMTSAASGLRTDSMTADALRADIARKTYGVTGKGVKIGILSDSFDVRGGMTADIADGNLPAGVKILEDGPAGSHDEGRAMAEIIHSIAPGAQILFHTGIDGEADAAAGIAALKAAGCTVIVDDVAYLDEPFFQDGGALEAAVEHAVAGGANYFTAASNEGQDFVQQSFHGMRVSLPGLPRGEIVQNFGTAAKPMPSTGVTVPTGGMLKLDMQWDQPFASIGRGHGSANSLGMALYDNQGRLVAAATANQVGGNPDQVLSFTNTTGGTSFHLVVFANGSATLPGLFKIINYGNGTLAAAGGAGSGTVIGHEMVAGDNTVGAVNWDDTTRFGGNNAVAGYSSVGTGDILFDGHGNRLAHALSSAKVNFLAPDGSLTSAMAPFYGTSAAAPAAAAVAALMLQADPRLTTTQVTDILEQTAAHATGAAGAVGSGLIQADAAVHMALRLAGHS